MKATMLVSLCPFSCRRYCAGLTVTALVLIGLGAPVTSLAQSDDFNDGNDDGWTRYNPLSAFGAGGTFSFPNGGYRIEAPSSPNPAVFGPGRAGSVRTDASYTDFSVSVDLVAWNSTIDQAIGVVARASEIGLGTTDGYALFYFPLAGALVINRFDNENATVPGLTAVGAASLNPDLDYRLVFTGQGNLLTGRVFALGDLTTPLATVTANDGTYGSGFAGLIVSAPLPNPAGPADATFDNYLAVVPEPSTWALFLCGLAGLSAWRWRRAAK